MSLNVQAQIRENTFELQSFLADLDQWAGDVKQKDKALREGRVQPAGVPQFPPVRGRAPLPPDDAPIAKPLRDPAAELLERHKKDAGSKKKEGSAAAHTYESYRERWEKFDVDAALKQAEEDEPGPARPHSAKLPSVNSLMAVPPEPPQPQPQQDPMARIPNAPLPPSDPAAAAEAAKQEGNEAFKNGDYGLAVTHYTTSIAARPTAVTFANRAMARLKLGQHAEAEADCSQALALDPRYLKALQRRSTARRALKRLLLAIEDCEAALLLEPGSKVLREERASLIREYQAAEDLRPTAAAVPLAIRPLAEAEPRPPQKPAGEARSQPAPAQGAAPRSAPAAPMEDRGLGEQPAPRAAAAPAGSTAGAAAAATAVAERAAREASGRETAASGDSQAESRRSTADAAAAAAAAKASARTLPIPRNGTEFEKAWRSAGADPDAQVQLLKALEPAALPQLLKDSLTGPVLKAVLKAALGLLALRDVRAALALLQALVTVPRFSLATMSLSSKEKPELSALWDAAIVTASAAGEADVASALESLWTQFKLPKP